MDIPIIMDPSAAVAAPFRNGWLEVKRRIQALYGDDPFKLTRAKYIYVLNAATTGILLIFLTVFCLAPDSIVGTRTRVVFAPILVMQVAILIVCNSQLMRGRFAFAQGVTLGTAFVAAFGSVCLTGGFPDSIVIQVLVLPACMTFLLMGGRAGWIVSGATCALVFGQWLLTQHFGLVLPDFTSRGNIAASTALANLTVFALLVLTISLYDTANRRLRAELEIERASFAKLASVDDLTGLKNVRGFNRKLERAISSARNSQQEIAILYMDLDDFKPVNDMFGHDAGDEVLRVTGQRLFEAARPRDCVARLGGDEFAMIMTAPVGRQEVADMATRLRDLITAPVSFGGAMHRVGVSIGVRYSGLGNMNVADLIKAVDEAMYQDKMLKTRRKAEACPGAPVPSAKGQLDSDLAEATGFYDEVA